MKADSSALGFARTNTIRGIAYVCGAVLLFSVYNALAKWLATGYSPLQIMFFRGVFGLLPFAAFAVAKSGPYSLRSQQPKVQLLRATLGLASNLCFILAYRQMPLASAVAIGYAAPIFIAVLSVPLLAERVERHRWGAVVVGFLGVMLVAQPSQGVVSTGALLALAGTLFYALTIIATRRLGSSDSAFCTMLYSSGTYALVCGFLAPAVWITPSLFDLGLFVAVGVIAGLGLVLFAEAYRHAPASALAPFDYTGLAWAAMFGFVIWGEIPEWIPLAGIATIAISGFYSLYREGPSNVGPR